MREIVVPRFGPPAVMQLVERPTPEPGPGEVRVRLTSVGMNHADLMARRGAYRIASGDPPFVPGLEGGGVVEAVGPGVTQSRAGDRVILSPDAPRAGAGGTYRSHFVLPADRVLPAPDTLPDAMLGGLWLAYLTAWGCLVWKQDLQPGQVVLLPAASSAVAIAAAQIVADRGGVSIATTRTPARAERIADTPGVRYDHVVVTDTPDWWKRVKRIAADRGGVDVAFDPVAAGAFLDSEIKLLRPGGVVWVYGLLGAAGAVDVTPLIRKRAGIRGWVLSELIEAGDEAIRPGCAHVLDRIASGRYTLPLAGTFPLADAARAHEAMERAEHVGKLVLVP